MKALLCLSQKEKKNLYIAQEVKSLKNKRNYLWRRYTISKSHADYLVYTKARNAFRALTRNLHKQFERQIADNIKKNPKTFWNYARTRMKTCPVIGNIKMLMVTSILWTKTYLVHLTSIFQCIYTRVSQHSAYLSCRQM